MTARNITKEIKSLAARVEARAERLRSGEDAIFKSSAAFSSKAVNNAVAEGLEGVVNELDELVKMVKS